MKKLTIYLSIISFALLGISCGNQTGVEGDIEESLEPVEDVTLIEGAENATITVNKNQDSYFSVSFSDVAASKVAESKTNEAWCIDWKKPIDSNSGTYKNIKLYSTLRVKKWNRLNYLFNIKQELMESDPELTYREIQVVIWSLRANPEFNLDQIETEDLPSRMRTNGQPNFSYQKVKDILDIIETNYQDFEFDENSKYAVIAETPPDVQTVIAVVN